MHAVEMIHFCLGCMKTYTEEEYRALPTRKMYEGGTIDFPICACGNILFNHEEKDDEGSHGAA